MRRPIAVLLVCASAAVAVPPASEPDESPAQLKAENARDRADHVREFSRLPRHVARPASQVIALTLEDGFVAVKPVDTDPTGEFAVDAAGWPGFLKLDASRYPDFLTLSHTAFSDDNSSEAITHVEVTPGHVQIGRDTEAIAGDDIRHDTVTLMQSRAAGTDDDPPVRLYLPGHDQKPLTATSFTELCRQYPDDVRQYLLPVLTDLGSPGVVRLSDPAAAWQVLGDRVPADPELSKKIDGLLKRLDADAFADRAKAEEDLAALGPVGAAALRQRDPAKLSPDPRASVEAAIRRNEPLPPEQAKAMGHSVPFLLETLMLDDPRLVTAAAERLKDVTGKAPPDTAPSLSRTEREKRVEAYRAQIAPTTAPAQ